MSFAKSLVGLGLEAEPIGASQEPTHIDTVI